MKLKTYDVESAPEDMHHDINWWNACVHGASEFPSDDLLMLPPFGLIPESIVAASAKLSIQKNECGSATTEEIAEDLSKALTAITLLDGRDAGVLAVNSEGLWYIIGEEENA